MGRPLGPLDVDPGRPYRESAAGDVLECPRRRHLPRPRGHSPPVTVSDASLPRDSPASAPQRSFCTSTLGCRQAPDAPFWRYPHGATARRSGADDLCSCSGAFRVFAECARSAVSSTDQRNTGLFGEALLSWLTLAMDERQKLAVDPPSPKTECPPRTRTQPAESARIGASGCLRAGVGGHLRVAHSGTSFLSVSGTFHGAAAAVRRGRVAGDRSARHVALPSVRGPGVR
jgi:hypothetical protein